jgi:hypothetical protein
MTERWLALKAAIRELLHPVDDDTPDSDHDPAVILDRWVGKTQPGSEVSPMRRAWEW